MTRPWSSCAKRLRVLLLVGIWVLSARSVTAQQTVTLEGQVLTERGLPVSTLITLRVETSEGLLVAEAPANSDGRFQFDALPKISCRLAVTAEGFQPFQRDLDLSRAAGKVVMNLILSAAAKTKPVPARPQALSDDKASRKARKELEQGIRSLEARQLPEARTHFERAVAEYPCYARAQTYLALTSSSQRDLEGAEAALRKAIQCDPGFPEAYALFGQLLNSQKRFAESEQVLLAGLRRAPSAWQFYYQLGAAHFGLGEFAKAQEEFLKVRSFNTTLPAELHVKLADVHLHQNAYDKAYEEMGAYLRAEPNGRFAAKIKRIMQEMESAGVLRSPQPEAAPLPPLKP